MRKTISRRFKVAAVQPALTAGKPDRNMAVVLGLLQNALRSGARLVVLPELFITGFDYECIRALPQRRTDECLREIRKMTRESEAVVVAGSVTMKKQDRIYNTSHVIGPDGRTKAAYGKMHLFPLMDEDAHLSPGDTAAIAKTAFGNIAPCICFDIRFPEVARRYALMGAQILAVPAEFPHPRLDHWRTLLKARAIENQFFVIASNRVGEDPTGHFFGHSMIISPTGEIIAEAGESEEVLLAQIDLAEVDAARKALPCLDRINPALASDIS